VPNSRIPRYGFRDGEALRFTSPEQQRFDPARLVAELDFKVRNELSEALKAKVPRLDNACMHRTHRNLMDVVSLRLKERMRRSVAGQTRWLQLGMHAQWLQPGVTFRPQPMAFEDVAFECLGLRQLRRQ
jgi:hypothetical protein